MTPLRRRFGIAVRQLRLSAGYSQESFADHVKVHRTYMGTVERGEVNITLENVEKIAKGLNLPTWKLLFETEEIEA